MQPQCPVPMRMAAVPDGTGGVVHRLVPAPPVAAAKGGSKRVVPDPIKTDGSGAADQLRLFIERIERLEEDKRGIGDDIKDVYLEAKATGYDAKVMREIIRLRAMAKDARLEHADILETYKAALGLE